MRALITAAILLALPASATWKSSLIPGTPTDVDTLDAGLAVVSSINPNGQMGLFAGSSAAGISLQQFAIGSFTSAAWRAPGCLVGLLDGTSAVQFSGSCGASQVFLSGGAGVTGRLRRLANGALYAYVWRSGGGQVRLQRAAPTAGLLTTDWNVLNLPLTDFFEAASPLSVLNVPSGADYFAWGYVTSGGSSTLALNVDGGPAFRTFPTGEINDVVLFDRDGGPAALMVVDGGFVQINLDLLNGAFTPVNVPRNVFSTVSFTAAGGSANGMGFGMLTVGNQIYSPVPNPNAIGQQWILRTEDAGFQSSLVRATCHDPRFCVAITSRSSARMSSPTSTTSRLGPTCGRRWSQSEARPATSSTPEIQTGIRSGSPGPVGATRGTEATRAPSPSLGPPRTTPVACCRWRLHW